MLAMANVEWETWVLAAATIIAGLIGGGALLQQLRALNRKNEFDLLQFVADRMRNRFQPLTPTSQTIWRTLTRLFRPDLVENGQLSSLSGQHRFYAIKGRFRTVVKEL